MVVDPLVFVGVHVDEKMDDGYLHVILLSLQHEKEV